LSEQFCPECGKENPQEARFCMNCGRSLAGEERYPASGPALRVPDPAQETGRATTRSSNAPDWAAIAAAVLAFFSLRHMSRRARQTFFLIAFFVLFFGCPLACGFVAYVMEWIARLFQ
jgi:uncharacterized membrane protein YvbJ